MCAHVIIIIIWVKNTLSRFFVLIRTNPYLRQFVALTSCQIIRYHSRIFSTLQPLSPPPPLPTPPLLPPRPPFSKVSVVTLKHCHTWSEQKGKNAIFQYRWFERQNPIDCIQSMPARATNLPKYACINTAVSWKTEFDNKWSTWGNWNCDRKIGGRYKCMILERAIILISVTKKKQTKKKHAVKKKRNSRRRLPLSLIWGTQKYRNKWTHFVFPFHEYARITLTNRWVSLRCISNLELFLFVIYNKSRVLFSSFVLIFRFRFLFLSFLSIGRGICQHIAHRVLPLFKKINPKNLLTNVKKKWYLLSNLDLISDFYIFHTILCNIIFLS